MMSVASTVRSPAARRLATFLLCVLFAVETAVAQLRIEITGVGAPTPIAIADTGADGRVNDQGREIASIVNDLLSSGLFQPIDSAAFIAPPGSPAMKPNFANWAPIGAKGLLVGSAILDGDGKLQVEFVLWDVVTERDLSSGTGSADRTRFASSRTRSPISSPRSSRAIPAFDTRSSMSQSPASRRGGSSGWRSWIRRSQPQISDKRP